MQIEAATADWEEVRLGEVLQTVSRSETVDDAKKYRLLGVRWYCHGARLHSEVGGSELKTRKLNRVQSGDITYNKMWVKKAAFAVLDAKSHDFYATSEYPTFRPQLSRVALEFLGALMRTKKFQEDAASLCKGSTSRARLHPNDFLRLRIPLPPLPEQRKIAAILSSVDEAIAATEQVIEQTRRVKEGLLQELLTRGIGHTRFKQTPIGEIPESWKVKRLGEVAELITKGASPNWQGFEYQDEGMAFITSKHVQDGYLDLSEVKHLPLEFNKRIQRSQLRHHDLLINIVGASIGRAAIWNATFPVANVNQAVAVVRLPDDSVRIELVLAQFLSPRGQDYFGLSQVDNARPNVSLKNLRDFLIAIPPSGERMAIADRVLAVEEQVRTNEVSLNGLQQTKAGLLQDLLTGKVRVSV